MHRGGARFSSGPAGAVAGDGVAAKPSMKEAVLRYYDLENVLRIRGYNTLRIVLLGLGASASVLYLYRDKFKQVRVNSS